MKHLILLALAAMLAAPLHAQRYAGGDLSLLTRYEENGAKYYTHDGTAITDVLTYLKDQGWNALRVRLFVDPTNATTAEKGEGVCQDLDYVKALGRRIKDAGFSLILDFHYSDTWADPAKQWTPKAWLSLSDTELYQKIYDYTRDALTEMKAAGAEPDFIQTGNEISYGMLWGDRGSKANRAYMGSTAGWERFTTLLSRAAKACREVCPKAKIILHTERVAEPGVLLNFYQEMKQFNVDYDIIGLSYYPYFHGDLAKLETALTKLDTNFPDKDIMVVETGYPYKWAMGDADKDISATYPYSDEGQKKFTDALIAQLRQHTSVKGLFWWFPEANEYGLDWNTKRVTDAWYNASLVDNNTGRWGSATSSLKTFIGNEAAIHTISSDEAKASSAKWYTPDGSQINKPTSRGLYIHRGRKVVL